MKTEVENPIKSKAVTVRELINSLSKFDGDAPVEIAVGQYNEIYPVAYCNPRSSVFSSDNNVLATMRNGHTVRIEIELPYDNKSFMMTSVRKHK